MRSPLGVFRTSRKEAMGYLLVKESKPEGQLMLRKRELLLPRQKKVSVTLNLVRPEVVPQDHFSYNIWSPQTIL